MAVGPARARAEAAARDRGHRRPVREVPGAARRPRVPRRPGGRRRDRRARRSRSGGRGRAAAWGDDRGEHRAQLRHAVPRGIPQGDPALPDGGEVPPPTGHLGRYTGRVPGSRGRGARPGRGDRNVYRDDDRPPDPDRRDHHRRGRIGRRARARGGGRRARAAERDLLGHFTRGRGGDPLAERDGGGEGRERAQARGDRPVEARHRRRVDPRAGGWRALRSPSDDRRHQGRVDRAARPARPGADRRPAVRPV